MDWACVCAITPPRIAAAVTTDMTAFICNVLLRLTIAGRAGAPRPTDGPNRVGRPKWPFRATDRRVRGVQPTTTTGRMRSTGLEQAAAGRLGDGGGARRDTEFAEDVGDVSVDGVVAEKETFGDVLIVQPPGDQAEHFDLARAESRGVLARPRRGWLLRVARVRRGRVVRGELPRARRLDLGVQFGEQV